LLVSKVPDFLPASREIVCNGGAESTAMAISRRSFLRSGAACALATGVLLKTPLVALGRTGAGADAALDFQIPYEATTSPVFHYTRETFEPYLKGIFVTAGVGGRKVELQLVAVRGYEPATDTRLTPKPSRRTDCFSLLFRASAPLRDLTTIHTIQHAALGGFDLFMTESGMKGERFCEAVINHVVAS